MVNTHNTIKKIHLLEIHDALTKVVYILYPLAYGNRQNVTHRENLSNHFCQNCIGAHTFGRAQCIVITPRLYNFNGTNKPDPSINPTFLTELRNLCPENGNPTVLANFDRATPNTFDSHYYTNLRQGKGVIQSDQELFSTPGADTIRLVELYSKNTFEFFTAFSKSMVRMGKLKPLTGTQGEVRLNCRVVNSRTRGVENEDDGVVSSI